MQRAKSSQRRSFAQPARHTDTVKVLRDDQGGEPRLPHERDESADSQPASVTQRGDIAHKAFDDVRAGRVDTDRGPVLEELFARQGPQGDRARSAARKRPRKR